MTQLDVIDMKARYTAFMMTGILLLSVFAFGLVVESRGENLNEGRYDRYDFFQVEINHPEDGAEFRDERVIRVEYTVTNLGGVEGRQEIIFSADHEEIESNDLNLTDGESYTGVFYWDISRVSEGEHILTVQSENTRDMTKVMVGTPPLSEATFQVDIHAPENRERFSPGDVVSVDYTVENLGREDGSQNINFMVDRSRIDVLTDLDLEAGENYRGSFSWDTQDVEDDYYSLSVSSDDTKDVVHVEIGSSKLSPAVFRVDVVSPEPRDEFHQEDIVVVNYTVENVGRENGTQNIIFSVDRWRKDVLYDLTLEPGEIYRGSFRWSTSDLEDSVYYLSVSSDDTNDTVPVIVGRPTDDESSVFDVEITAPESCERFEQGDNIIVEYTVENTGSEEDTQNIIFSVDRWRTEVLYDLVLGPGETYEGDFSWDTSQVESGIYYLSVQSDNMRDVVKVAVGSTDVSRALFRVDIIEPECRARFESGDIITVSYAIKNVGREEGTQSIFMRVDRSREDVYRELTLEPGETYEGNFTWDTSGAPDDVYHLSVHSDNTVDAVSIILGEAPWERDVFKVRITAPERREQFEHGDVIDVSYMVKNIGRAEGTQDILFGVNRIMMDDHENLTLEPGEAYEGRFRWNTSRARRDVHHLHVRSRDTADVVPIVVESPARILPYYRVRIEDHQIEQNRVTVRFTVTNTAQSTEGAQRVVIILRTRDSERVAYEETFTLGSGETRDEEFTWEADSDRYTVELKSMDEDIELDSETMELTVEGDEGSPWALPMFALIMLVVTLAIISLAIRERSGKKPVRESQYDRNIKRDKKDWSDYYDRD